MENEDKTKVETEVIEIEGHQAEVSVGADGTIAIKVPESLAGDPDALKKWKEDVEKADRDKFLPNLYKNRHQTEQELERLRQENEQLKNGGGQLPDTPKAGNDREDPRTAPVWKRLGLTSEDELDEFMAENPKAYRKAQDSYFEDLADLKAEKRLTAASTQAQETTQQLLLTQRITSDGNNPAEFKAWLNYQKSEGLAMPYNEAAYRMFLKTKADKSDPTLKARADSQKRQISFVEPGNVIPPNVHELSDKQLEELAKTNPQQYKAIKEYLKKKAVKESR